MVAPWEMEWSAPAPAPARQSRGLRNNNPLNLEATVNWSGMEGNDGRFAVFPDMESGVAAADRNLQTYGAKHGINTVSGVINRWAPPGENDSRAYAQTVANKIGVGVDDELNMADPGTRRSLLDAMADVENGQEVDLGGGQVAPWQMAWGGGDGGLVQAATPGIQAGLAGGLRSPLGPLSGGGPAPEPPMPPEPYVPAPVDNGRRVASSKNGGVTIDLLPPEDPTIAQDVWSGFTQPFRNLGNTVASEYRRGRETALAGPPKSLAEAGRRTVDDLLATPRMVGDLLGLTSAPIQAAVRPIARDINRLPIRPYTQDTPMSAPRAMGQREAQGALEGAINTALSGARPATVRAPTVKTKAMSVDQLRDAKTAAYQAVDQMGVRYDPSATAKLATDISTDLASKRINPKVTPKAHAVMEDVIDQLSSGQPVPLSQLDDMRQQVWRATGKGDDAEKFFGDRIRDMIDDFADNAGAGQVITGNAPDAAQAIRAAREANRRYRNVQEVTNRVESADLRASSTYAGGNHANATRQNLRPLIDPKSQQRLKGLKPEEAAALKRVVKGTAGQNALRVTGKVLDPRGLLGAAVQTVMGLPSGGASAVTIPAGIAASELSNLATARAVNEALKLLSVGGKPPPLPPPVIPRVPVLSPGGIAGLGVTATPLTRIPSRAEGRSAGKSAKSKSPQRR